jgi:hypothetical protein
MNIKGAFGGDLLEREGERILWGYMIKIEIHYMHT